jgi:cell volume regulation protein A
VGLGLLALPGVLITTVIVALVVAPVFGVPFPVALMIGAVLASTDPAILIPLFDRLNIRPKVSQTLISESGFNDTTGAVLTLALVGRLSPDNSPSPVRPGSSPRSWPSAPS